MSPTTYYISTGAKSGFYTLRFRFMEAYQICEGESMSGGQRLTIRTHLHQ